MKNATKARYFFVTGLAILGNTSCKRNANDVTTGILMPSKKIYVTDMVKDEAIKGRMEVDCRESSRPVITIQKFKPDNGVVTVTISSADEVGVKVLTGHDTGYASGSQTGLQTGVPAEPFSSEAALANETESFCTAQGPNGALIKTKLPQFLPEIR